MMLEWREAIERRCPCGTLVYSGPPHACHAGAVEARGLAGLVRACVARWARAEGWRALGVPGRRLVAVWRAGSGAIGTAAGWAGACGGLPSSSDHLAALVGMRACTRGRAYPEERVKRGSEDVPGMRERASERTPAPTRSRKVG